MKQFPYFVALLLVASLSACMIPGLAAATPTAVPTNTALPSPTATPKPTNTATLTPDLTATKSAQTTQAAGDVMSELDASLGDTDIPYQQGHLVWKQKDPNSIELEGPDHAIVGIGKKVTASNFIFKFDVTWEATGLLVCGTIFRSEADMEKGKQYQFVFMRFSGLPAWEIDVFEFGQFRNTPSKTKYSDALDLSNGATNEFLLAAQNEQFTLYINGQRQGTYYDWSKQRNDGTFGFIGWEQSGEGRCQFKNSWVWALE